MKNLTFETGSVTPDPGSSLNAIIFEENSIDSKEDSGETKDISDGFDSLKYTKFICEARSSNNIKLLHRKIRLSNLA